MWLWRREDVRENTWINIGKIGRGNGDGWMEFRWMEDGQIDVLMDG